MGSRAVRPGVCLALLFLAVSTNMESVSAASIGAKTALSTRRMAGMATFDPDGMWGVKSDVKRARAILAIMALSAIITTSSAIPQIIRGANGNYPTSNVEFAEQRDFNANTFEGRRYIGAVGLGYFLSIVAVVGVLNEVTVPSWRFAAEDEQRHQMHERYRESILDLLNEANEERALAIEVAHSEHSGEAGTYDVAKELRKIKSHRAFKRDGAQLEEVPNAPGHPAGHPRASRRHDTRSVEGQQELVQQDQAGAEADPVNGSAMAKHGKTVGGGDAAMLKMKGLNRQVFKNEFSTEIDDKGMVTIGDMRVFLAKVGLSENAARFFIEQMDWQKTGRLSFDDFKRVMLAPAAQSAKGINDIPAVSSQITLFLVVLMLAALDGGTDCRIFIAAFTAGFTLLCAMVYSVQSYLNYGDDTKKDNSEKITMVLENFKTVLKMTCGLGMTIAWFLLYALGRRMCAPARMSCTGSGNVTMKCNLYRAYLNEGPEGASPACVPEITTGLQCAENGDTAWHATATNTFESSNPVKTAIKDGLQKIGGKSYDMPLDEMWDLVGSENPGALRATMICPSEPEPPQMKCQVIGAADSLVTLEDVGSNQIDATGGHLEVGAEKDVKFVHYKSNDCGADTALYTTVRPRVADETSDWEAHLPAQSRKSNSSLTLKPVMVMDVKTPSTGNEPLNYFHMCQRIRNPAPQNWTLVTECLYVFAPRADCGSPNCDAADTYGAADYEDLHGSVSDSWYYAMITQSSIGFGDIGPTTTRNKLTVVLHGLLMMFISML